MKTKRRPMLTTVLFGLGCGICFIPVSMVLSYCIHWPLPLHWTAWAFFALYGLLLTRWGRVSPLPIVFPLVLLFVFTLWGNSHTAFLLMALVIVAWIRSGICFQRSRLKAMGAELLICLGGGGLVTYFTPHSPGSWAMVLWALFLVQSLYFVLLGEMDKKPAEETIRDPFEEIRRRAERILSTHEKHEI
jgi:hypothetical protein